MNTTVTNASLRGLTAPQLEQLGQQSLRDHLVAQATFAHQKHSPITAETLDRLLQDPACVRYPVRLVFEYGEMALHQFAQPDLDWKNTGSDGRVLYLRPDLRQRPALIPPAVAYMLPLVNYGAIITDDHCLLYGATLLGMMEQDYYQLLCQLADQLGAIPQVRTSH